LKRVFAIILSLCMTFSVVGCGDDVPKTEPLNPEKEELSFESTISVFVHKPDTLCPLLSTSETNVQMLQMLFDSLIELSDDMTAKPCLATSWYVSDGGKKWTVQLKNNVKWHDGTPFEAKDVIYTVNQIKKADNSVYSYNVSNISEIRAKEQFVVEIELENPWPNFVNLMYFPIVKSGSGDINPASFSPVGTGPYVFKSNKEDPTYYLVRNENWWGGEAVTECIKVEILADAETALYAFSAGTIDMAMAIDENWGKFVDPETATYSQLESTEFCFVGVNHMNNSLKFPEVRKAISYAVNREEIVNVLKMGYATATKLPVHPKWQLGANYANEIKQDTEAAKIELEAYEWKQTDSGWEKSVDDVYCKTDFRLLYNEENGVRRSVAELIKENLESVGISILLEEVPYADYEARISSGDYDLFLGSVIVAPDVDFSFVLDEGNLFNYDGGELKAVRDGMRTVGIGDLASAYAPILEKFDAENPVVSLFFEKKILVHSKRVEGDMSSSSFDVFRGIESLQKKEVEE